MKVVSDIITIDELKMISEHLPGKCLKTVVDVEKGIMILDATLETIEEEFLLDHGSKLADLWGVCLYPFEHMNSFIDYDSFVNVKPNQDNSSTEVEDVGVRGKIATVINSLVRN